MKLGLLGAPGSGKSKIARQFVKSIQAPDDPWGIVDGYVDRLQKQTGVEFGANSNVAHNLSVITTRWIKEAELWNKGIRNTITCGTLYESVLYTTFTTMFTSPIETDIAQQNALNQIVMQALGVLERTTYDYDMLFFLPYDAKAQVRNEHTWNEVVNAKIPEVLEGFSKKAIVLNQQSVRSKVQTIIGSVERMNDYYADIVAANEQPAV